MEYTLKKGETVTLSPKVTTTYSSLKYQWEHNGKVVGNEDSITILVGNFGLETGLNTLKFVASNEDETENKSIEYRLYLIENHKYKRIGYWPVYSENSVQPNDKQLEKLTHIVCSFLTVATDGTLSNINLEKNLESLVKKAHAKGVYVMVAIGGGANHTFGDCIIKLESRTRLVDNILKYIDGYNIDGIDIDFEAWTGGNSAEDKPKSDGLLSLLSSLKAKIHKDKFIGMPVMTTDWVNYNYTTEMYQYVDWIGLMLYDYTGTWSSSPYGQHASYQDFTKYIDLWQNNKSLPKDKLIVGLPFYGYKFKSEGVGGIAEGVSYKNIVSRYSDANTKDEVGTFFYNGQTTIAKKSEYVKENGYNGVLIWEITQDLDSDNSKSLLKTIDGILR